MDDMDRTDKIGPLAHLDLQSIWVHPMPPRVRQELIATIGMLGAALTVLARLEHVLPLAGWLGWLAQVWTAWTQALWRPLFELVGINLHPDIAAGLTLSLFLGLIGVGAAIAQRRRLPGVGIAATWNQRGYDLAALLVFATLVLVFLFGRQTTSGTGKIIVLGSESLGRLAFASVTALGFVIGEAIGGTEFRLRLLRMAGLVAVLVALSAAARWLSGAP
jgi:hypothetical protein